MVYTNFYPRINDTKTRDPKTMQEIAEIIKSDQYEVVTRKCKDLYKVYLKTGKESDKAQYSNHKAENLPYFTPSGTFTYRNDKGLETFSGFICFDYDHLLQQEKKWLPNDLARALQQDSKINTVLTYCTPSGDGLKQVVYQANATLENRQTIIDNIRRYVEAEYKVLSDSKVDKLSQPEFLCHDYGVYYNEGFETDPRKDYDWTLVTTSAENSADLVAENSAANSTQKCAQYSAENSAQQAGERVKLSIEEQKANAQKLLYRLWDVRRDALHVCDTYDPYFQFVSACAASTGKFGRDACREICQWSLNFNAEAFEKLYTEQLDNPKNTFTFGTVQHLVEVAGGVSPVSPISQCHFFDIRTEDWSWDDRPRWIPKGENRTEEICYIMGFLTAASAVMPHVWFKWFGDKYYPNLFTIIKGPKGSGKGRVKKTIRCIDAINNYVRNTSSEDEPFRVKVSPDSTDAALIRNMDFNQNNINKGSLFMYAPELDIVGQKKKIGLTTEDTRLAFGHEEISKDRLGWDAQSRKEGRKGIYIPEPRLSLLFTGTPNQLTNYFTNNEDGNLTRFLIYSVENDTEWRSGFNYTNTESLQYDDFCEMWGRQMEKGIETEMKCTEEQQDRFTELFKQMKGEFVALTDDFAEYSHRFAVEALRITAVICTAEQWAKGLTTDERITPTDQQLGRGIQFVLNNIPNIYRVHTNPAINHTDKVNKQAWIDMLTKLGDKFKTKDFVNLAVLEGYSEGSARNALTYLRNANYIRSSKMGDCEKVK